MITIDELKFKLGGLETAVNDLRDALSIEASEKRLAELEHQMTLPGFYDDQEKSQKVISEMGEVKNKLERFGKLSTQYEEAQTLLEMIEEENDPSLAAEGEEAVNGVEKSIDELQLMTMLNGEYDHSNAILTFHAGTGGTEAQDWAEMLTRMYTRWAEAHGYTVEVLDVLEGDEAGIKSASMMIKGANAYGMLKSENGVHRLVRISPFDANARRQTSFSSLEVMPELDNNIKVEINPADIEMQVYRSSGAGGQHINKTSSAVRLIHKPTGIVTSCQTQRSQLQNREYAMEMLKNTGHEEISLSSLSSSDYSKLPELIDFLMEECDKRHINISLPSLRIDAFSLDVMSKVQDVKKSSLTFAPEAGSQRLRDVINKGLTEEVILQGSALAFEGGWTRVKLYFMLGHPTETEEDIRGIAELSNKIAATFFDTVPKEKRVNGRVQIVTSTSFFVPKPFTPFQWAPQCTKEEFVEKAYLTRKAISEQLNQKSIKYNWHEADVSVLEGVLARGDRRLSQVLLYVY